jgi:hypothetical protein
MVKALPSANSLVYLAPANIELNRLGAQTVVRYAEKDGNVSIQTP